MEIVTDLNSRSPVNPNSKNNIDDSNVVCDISTRYMVYHKTGIEKLNDDCLVHIFTYIPLANRLVLGEVCRRWSIVVRQSWRSFKKFDFDVNTWKDDRTRVKLALLDIPILQKVLYQCGSFLTHIDFSERIETEKEIGGEVVSVFAKYCKNLQYINIPNGILNSDDQDTIYEKELSKLFLNNKKIRFVKLENTSILGECLLNLPADSLETLVIDTSFNIYSCLLEKVVEKFKKLHTLSLHRCRNFNYKTFKTICSSAKSLKELQLIEYEVPTGRGSYQLSHIVEFINLEILDVPQSNYINDEFLKVIGQKCKKLIKINIEGCFQISNEGLAYIVTLPKLQHLNISINYQITDEGLCQLIKKSHNLQLLDVTGCLNLTNELVEVAIEATKNRTNNVTLEMYIAGYGWSGIDLKTITNTSPFLKLCTH